MPEFLAVYIRRGGLTEGLGEGELGPSYLDHILEPSLQAIETRLAELVALNRVVPQIQTVFELAQAVEGQSLSETGHTRGKVVLRVDVKPAGSRIANFDVHESLGNAGHDGLGIRASQPAHRKEFPD